MHLVILLLAGWLFAMVAWGDLKERRIPNALSLAVTALALLRLTTVGNLVVAGYTIAAGVAVFAVGFTLFSRGLIGGGDTKLVTASSLLVGYPDILTFIFGMGICGGVLALLVLAEAKAGKHIRATLGFATPLSGENDASAAADPAPSVPYGVAISVAAMWVLVEQTLHMFSLG